MCDGGNFSSIRTGRKTVTTAGTAEQMPDVPVPVGMHITIKALDSNTGEIYLAPNQTDAGNSNTRFTLSAGQAIELRVINANMLWLNSSVNGEGIEYIVER